MAARGSRGRYLSHLRVVVLAITATLGLTQAMPSVGALAGDGMGSCTAVSGTKPLIRGLVDRGAVPPAASLDASSIAVPWNVLEPLGPGLVANNPIDKAIAASGCTPLRIRVLAGIATPSWVLAKTGSVNVTNPYDASSGTAGLFWTNGYKTLYDNLESELAAKYDSVPNVDEFVVSRCALFYPEPFILGTSVASNDSALVAAGYTPGADEACLQEEIDTARGDWHTTRIGVSFNPYQVLTPTGGGAYTTGVDESYTEQMMAYCRYELGSRCVLENDSVRDPISSLSSTYVSMYAAMTGASGPIDLTLNGIDTMVPLGAPLAFQTAVASRVGDFWGTLEWARKNHAASVELPVDGSYPTSGGSGSPAWQTLPEVAMWFEEVPSVTPHALTVEQGKSTLDDVVATLTIDEQAAVDTQAGYGDIGSVPFDTVSAAIHWPTGVQDAGLVSIGTGSPAATVTCGAVRWCTVAIASPGYAFPEVQVTTPASVAVNVATGGHAYVPADGVAVVASVPVTTTPAPLTVTSFAVTPAKSTPAVSLGAEFVDGDPLGTASNYTIRIDWGDGSTSKASATANSSGFSVSATHRYTHAGVRTVKITIANTGGAKVTAHTSVTVN